ncbi:unnamed protein product [Pieris macdunnoughi]|uniref:Uncharacterized protein n=1 Tax=Pieris macdunnoughi TaxID=345717 RepID=A0A821TM14_9NEOP|nr:unnamed protein product [Pieris macdunnoughi]
MKNFQLEKKEIKLSLKRVELIDLRGRSLTTYRTGSKFSLTAVFASEGPRRSQTINFGRAADKFRLAMP